MDFDTTLAQMNITLGDSGNVTFTVEEKTRALQKAWKDSNVVEPGWDTSLTFSDTTYQYAVPATMTTIQDIYISASNTII